MEVLELNHQAMRAADSEARRTAVRSGVWLGVLVLLALFSLVVLSRWLHQRLLLRLDELAEATEAIAAGDVRRRLPVAASDELGRIATRLNQGLDAHQELRAEMAGRLSQERQLTLALFDAFGAGRIVLDLGGKVIIQDSAPIDPGVLAAVEAWIRARGQPILIDPAGLAELSDPVRIDSESGACYLQLLTARDKRPIGWLARAQESERVAAQATSS